MKKILAAALLLAMMLALAACGSSSTTTTTTTTTTAASEEKAVTLKLAHNLAEDHAVNIAMTAWAEAVNEASNGSITIEIYPNGTLGSESDCVSQLQAGGLEMTKVSAGTLGNFKNEWNAVSVPYVFNDKEHYYNVMDGEIAEDLYALTEDDGFIGLTWLDSGSRSFYTADTPIRTPSDLKGLKIRTMDSQMAIDMMTALGGSATVMSYSDIYTGMQNHVVDGAENNITAMRDHADVTKYYCFDEHTRIPDIVVISTKAWNSLSENQQNILKSTAVDMTENYKTLWAEFEDEVRQQAEEAGVEFITDVDTAAFQEACQSIYENLKTSDPDTYAFVERIQAVA
jgi:tripartite ATP-independent transporter DctP family solute receptor